MYKVYVESRTPQGDLFTGEYDGRIYKTMDEALIIRDEAYLNYDVIYAWKEFILSRML